AIASGGRRSISPWDASDRHARRSKVGRRPDTLAARDSARYNRRRAMLDLLIRNGQVVTPEGAGAWEIAVQDGKIVAVAAPETFREASRVIDAAGKIVVPGGVEPHTHLAHRIQMHPNDDLHTLGPEDDSRGMAFGGTTTHVDFAFVRPDSNMQAVIEQRAARW